MVGCGYRACSGSCAGQGGGICFQSVRALCAEQPARHEAQQNLARAHHASRLVPSAGQRHHPTHPPRAWYVALNTTLPSIILWITNFESSGMNDTTELLSHWNSGRSRSTFPKTRVGGTFEPAGGAGGGGVGRRGGEDWRRGGGLGGRLFPHSAETGGRLGMWWCARREGR